MNTERRRAHPERVEALEVKMDLVLPGQTPVLELVGSFCGLRRVSAIVPKRESNKLYVGRLVVVEDGEGKRQPGCVEALDGLITHVRLVDWET